MLFREKGKQKTTLFSSKYCPFCRSFPRIKSVSVNTFLRIVEGNNRTAPKKPMLVISNYKCNFNMALLCEWTYSIYFPFHSNNLLNIN